MHARKVSFWNRAGAQPTCARRGALYWRNDLLLESGRPQFTFERVDVFRAVASERFRALGGCPGAAPAQRRSSGYPGIARHADELGQIELAKPPSLPYVRAAAAKSR